MVWVASEARMTRSPPVSQPIAQKRLILWPALNCSMCFPRKWWCELNIESLSRVSPHNINSLLERPEALRITSSNRRFAYPCSRGSKWHFSFFFWKNVSWFWISFWCPLLVQPPLPTQSVYFNHININLNNKLKSPAVQYICNNLLLRPRKIFRGIYPLFRIDRFSILWQLFPISSIQDRSCVGK